MDCGGREAARQDSCGQGGVEQTEKIAWEVVGDEMPFKHFVFVFGSLQSQCRVQKSPQGSELLGDLRLTQMFPWLQR